MELNELREIIIQTNDDFWHQLEIGPFYHDRIYVAGDLDFEGTSHSHYERAVLISDVDISLEWGMDADGREKESHAWADAASFPDPTIRSQVVDVFYRGALVDRTSVISVDGGRAYVPQYKTVRTDAGEPHVFKDATFEYRATRWNYYLTQLINQLAGHRDFESYVVRSGITLE